MKTYDTSGIPWDHSMDGQRMWRMGLSHHYFHGTKSASERKNITLIKRPYSSCIIMNWQRSGEVCNIREFYIANSYIITANIFVASHGHFNSTYRVMSQQASLCLSSKYYHPLLCQWHLLTLSELADYSWDKAVTLVDTSQSTDLIELAQRERLDWSNYILCSCRCNLLQISYNELHSL